MYSRMYRLVCIHDTRVYKLEYIDYIHDTYDTIIHRYICLNICVLLSYLSTHKTSKGMYTYVFSLYICSQYICVLSAYMCPLRPFPLEWCITASSIWICALMCIYIHTIHIHRARQRTYIHTQYIYISIYILTICICNIKKKNQRHVHTRNMYTYSPPAYEHTHTLNIHTYIRTHSMYV